MFNDASAPNSREPNSDDMENWTVSGLAGDGSRGMGCFDGSNTSQMASRSMHTGGMNLTMADGSVRVVSENINFKRTMVGCGRLLRGVWQAIHTRAPAVKSWGNSEPAASDTFLKDRPRCPSFPSIE